MNNSHDIFAHRTRGPERKCMLVDMNGNKRAFLSEASASRYLKRSAPYLRTLRMRGETIATSSAGEYYRVLYLSSDNVYYVSLELLDI